MAIDGLTPAIVFPLFNFVIRGVQTAYEVASVPAETSDYLKTISHVMVDLKIAKQLRRQNSDHLSHEDLVRVDNIIQNIEDAMRGVEVLVERARVDMSISPGNVSARSRIMWVIRDQNKIAAAMSRLAISSQSLHREITMLKGVDIAQAKYDYSCGKDYYGYDKYDDGYDDSKSPWADSRRDSISERGQAAPPTYLQATIDAMNERRRTNERRNPLLKKRPGSTMSGNSIKVPTTFPAFYDEQNYVAYNDENNDVGFVSATMTKVAEYIRHNEATYAALAPAAPSAPRDLLPATIVDRPDNPDKQDMASELEGNPHPAAPYYIRPVSLSLPPMPTWPSSDHKSWVTYPIVPKQLHALTVSSPNLPFNNTSAPSASQWRRLPPPPPPKPRGMTAEKRTSMQSTAMIPGHQEPMSLRWSEPANQDDARVDRSPMVERDAFAQEYYAPSNESATNIMDEPPVMLNDAQQPEETMEPLLGRAPTRKRQARIQRDFNLNATVLDHPQTQREDQRRGVKPKSSRLDWQMQRQMDELARLGE